MHRHVIGLAALGCHLAYSLPQQTNVDPHPEGITDQMMKDAYPERDPAKPQNWYGTSLYGWEYVQI